MFIKGNIDPVNILLKGNSELIRQDVKRRIEIGSKYPGFILSTACAIAPDTPYENLILLRKLING
jgi:uroporphyrinogen-III decarboxylase